MHIVGLITCERIVLGKGAKVLICESAQGTCPPTSWKKKVKTRRMKRKMGEKMDSKKSRKDSRRESEQPLHERMRMTHAMTCATHQT